MNVVRVTLGAALVIMGGCLLFSDLLPIEVFGFMDFCYEGQCWHNPSALIATGLGGVAVPVDRTTVSSLPITGPAVGIGLDSTVDAAYINGTAFGKQSLAANGPDAGDYLCGQLFARLLKSHPCSLFVHVPQTLGLRDYWTVYRATWKVRFCALRIGAAKLAPGQNAQRY